MTNENEARPCGGYASVYGVLSVFPPKVELKNVYALADVSFGPTQFPLSKVAPEKYFWDAGVDTDVAQCAEQFRQHYQFAREENIDHVLLVDFETVEAVAQLFDSFRFQGESFGSNRLFEALSRSVADVDRHDEESLATRKSPLAHFGKTMIRRSILNPTVLPRVTRIVRERMNTGAIYSSKTSPIFSPHKDDFSVVEWNLGGGKSSRYLKKNIEITGREISPDQWQWKVRFTADHLGGYDEPLSQEWKGVFVFSFPSWIGQEPITKEEVILPGERYQKGFIFETQGRPPSQIGLFAARGQEMGYDIELSVYPQQGIQGDFDEVHENVAFQKGALSSGRKTWNIEVTPDKTNPFVTIHTVVPLESLPKETQEGFREADMIVELHTNEKVLVDLDMFVFTLTDKDHTNQDKTFHPELVVYDLMPDGRTLYGGFRNKDQQFEERYSLTLRGLKDLSGNVIKEGPRTLIDRVLQTNIPKP